MHCPLSGKICLMPKEIFVTELKNGEVNHLYMCRMCGEEYIKNLNNGEVITKSLEVVSSDGNLSHNERILNESDEENGQRQQESIPKAKSPNKKNQIKALEAKMQDAVDQENYEKASSIRDIIKEMKSTELN